MNSKLETEFITKLLDAIEEGKFERVGGGRSGVAPDYYHNDRFIFTVESTYHYDSNEDSHILLLYDKSDTGVTNEGKLYGRTTPYTTINIRASVVEDIKKRLTAHTIAVSDEKLQHFMDYLT